MTTKTAISAKNLFMLLFMLSSLHIMAQRTSQKAAHEFSLNAGAGVSTYVFSPLPKNLMTFYFIQKDLIMCMVFRLFEKHQFRAYFALIKYVADLFIPAYN